jgi:hypothetical protein
MNFADLVRQISFEETEIKIRFMNDLLEHCSRLTKLNSEYFDFYLEPEEDHQSLIDEIRSAGFESELLVYDRQIIHRRDMSDCEIPSFSLLRIYNANQED